MKIALTAVFVSTLALAGCASSPDQLAQTDCKITRTTTLSTAGVTAPKADSADKRLAQSQFATSDARRLNLARYSSVNNMWEDALRDCTLQ